MISRRSNGRKAREASAAAERSVHDQEVMVLSAEDSAVFAAALLRPVVPRQRLRKAAERYQKGV
jgi:uncharacterized protein (DUF1778 family)